MTREELGNNISAYIASATMGCTNIEITSAIMKDVDAYAPRFSPQIEGGAVRADAIRAAIENLGYDLKLREFAPRTEIGIRNFNERCEYLAAALAPPQTGEK